jgi:predicted GNAT family acetyltransferase
MSTTLWSSQDGTLEVLQDHENRFFEVRVCGSPAGLLVYEQRGNHVDLTHTTVREECRGKGLATVMIREALLALQSENAVVVNHCPVVGRFAERNHAFAAMFSRSR